MDDRALAERLYRAALTAVDPVTLTADAARGLAPLAREAARVHVLALGKAAPGMAAGAVAALAEHGIEPAGGLIVGVADGAPPHPALAVTHGDHPYPGVASRAAAEALGRAAARVGPADLAIVLVSGGTSSLIGAPVPGLEADELGTLTRTLLGAGVDIGVVNGVRRRLTRWGAGRLAAALAQARVDCLVLSDVPGYDASVVGSGPCAPETVPADALIAALTASGVWKSLAPNARSLLDRIAAGDRLGAPAADDPAFERAAVTLLADNRTACAAAANAARLAALTTVLHDESLSGEARDLGRQIARVLEVAEPGSCHVWGGEPAVTLRGAPHNALGGRMQELALAAARHLPDGVTLLAAGTDGRDGPTDAAGAIVDGDTWHTIAAIGRDPADDLAAHRSHAALHAVGALLRTGPTGTNVADVVIGIVRSAATAR